MNNLTKSSLSSLEELHAKKLRTEAEFLVSLDPEVNRILSLHPDCSANVYFAENLCTIYLSSYFYDSETRTVEVPSTQSIAFSATDCDNDGYTIHYTSYLLTTDEVKIHLSINAYFDFPASDKETLLALGKLQHETSTRTYLACNT
jgi:hypothetical protein